jgi:hypothetical protein
MHAILVSGRKPVLQKPDWVKQPPIELEAD